MTKKELENLSISDFILYKKHICTICGISRVEGNYEYELVDERGDLYYLTDKNMKDFHVIKGKD